MMKGVKAVGLLSGGLDSTLSAKVLMDQGIEVHAINFVSPFCTCTPKSMGCSAVVKAVEQLGNIPLKRVSLGDEYLLMVKSPKHGYGRAMNPCIDCRIMKIKKAAEYMREIGASFLFTGEVLGQRPMSQHRRAMEIIDKESGCGEYILRPLSAQLFAPTISEKEGWVNRDALLSITGRSRKPQIELAKQKGINDYRCAAGGCLLTDKNFAKRLKDYFLHVESPSMGDIQLLKIGRHFWTEKGDWIIVARNDPEGHKLLALRGQGSIVLAPTNFSAPAVFLRGSDRDFALRKMHEFVKHSVPTHAMIQIFDGQGDPAYLLSEF